MLTPSFYPKIGGVEKHVYKISKELVKKKHKVLIITKKIPKELENYENLGDLYIIRLNNKKILSFWINLFQIRKIIKLCDIIHCHDFITFYWFLPFYLLNSNVYLTFHGYEKYPIPKIYIYLRKLAEILVKGNICVGKFIAKYYHTNPTIIIYGGVNNNLNNNVKNTNFNFNKALFIGRLDVDTGILEYIKALKILKEKYNKNLKLEICGDGVLKDLILKYAKKFDLSINFNGFVKDLNVFFNQVDIVLCSSYLCILEALSKKKIVISIYQNILKKDYLELTPFKKYIFISKNPNQIAKEIINLAEKQNKINEKIKKGYIFALRYTWNRIIRIYEKLWKINIE
ncbi:MAG: glycosyltransferase family 4 protein [Promethearchaeota archaeon]